MALTNIRHLSEADLRHTMTEWGEKPYRVVQLQEWLWKKGVSSIDEMSNLSQSLREKLKTHYSLDALKIHLTQVSQDQTIKNRFILYDGYFVEGVLIPSDERMTACVSSQVGCSLTCKFCATGTMERKRNLHFDEIVDQVMILNRQSVQYYQQKLSNIVFMGMGEPLLNYSQVLKSIERITSPDGLGMSPSRITVSTAGVAKMIERLANDQVKFNLALSLHAANDAKRNEIMPINETNNLKTLIQALDTFYKATRSPVTFEYILFNNFNDSLTDADELIRICRRIPSKVNIIEYNPIGNDRFSKPGEESVFQFMQYLGKHGVNARLRKSRGKDIDAACGQLANVNSKTIA